MSQLSGGFQLSEHFTNVGFVSALPSAKTRVGHGRVAPVGRLDDRLRLAVELDVDLGEGQPLPLSCRLRRVQYPHHGVE